MSDVLRFPTPHRFQPYNSDPSNLPTPPEGARIVEIRDEHGTVICGAWVAPIFDGDAFEERLCSYARFLEMIIQRPACEA